MTQTNELPAERRGPAGPRATTAVRLAGLAFLVVLGACSSPPEETDRVATMDTTENAPTSASTADPTASRPRERLDMTPEEGTALYTTYEQCLTDHGYGRPGPVSGAGDEPMAPAPRPDESKRPAAEAACLSKKPLPPWEYDTANPESADFVHAVVQCLRDQGVQYVEEAELEPGEDRRSVAFGGPDNDPTSISKGMELAPGCEKELSNGGPK